MDNYVKGETKEEDDDPKLLFASIRSPEALKAAPVMRVKVGSKIRNMTTFVHKHLKEEAHRDVIFSGMGAACAKTISCVEVFKRESKSLVHQQTQIAFRRIEEFWEPQIDGLERLKVNRDIPSVAILVSKDAMPGALGVQDSALRRPPSWLPLRPHKDPAHKEPNPSNRWKRPRKDKSAPKQNPRPKLD